MFFVFIALVSLLINGLRLQAAEEITPDYTHLALQTSVVGGAMVIGMSWLWMAPEEKSQWYDKPDFTPSDLYRRWKKNGNQIWGSSVLGYTLRFLMNPLGVLTQNLKDVAVTSSPLWLPPTDSESNWFLKAKFRF